MRSFSKFLYVAFAVMILCFFVHTDPTFAAATTSAYVYDGLNQLTQVTNSDGTSIVYNYDAMGNRVTKTVSGAPIPDTIAPTVTGFTVPAAVHTLQVPVTLFTATDNVAVTGYIITESATAPSVGVGGWSSTAPTSYTAAITGPHTLYAYAKDAAGNVSVGVGATVSIDTIAPIVTGFSVPSVVHTLQVPVTLFTATDNVAVVGYIITESATAPNVGGTAWSSTAPPSYAVATAGAHTLYAYVKDAAGNVSVGVSAPVSISIIQSYIGVLRNGTWYIDANGNEVWNPGVDITISYGTTGDIPVVGDWTGNGIRKLGVFRGGTWLLDMNGNNAWDSGDATIVLGQTGDFPVVGNWNGSADGKDKIGVFRNGTWYLDYSGRLAATGIWDGCGAPADQTKDACLAFGQAGDIPVVGDWNGDCRIKIGVFRGGTWLLDMNGNNVWDPSVDVTISFGMAGDIPVVGDWNRNGITKIGVFRPSTGNWCLDMNNNDQWDSGVDSLTVFGTTGDQPFVK